eukprot:376488-Pyramimonas_sp.AAC.1
MDQSDTGSVGVFSPVSARSPRGCTRRVQHLLSPHPAYSHNGPIRRRKCGHILMMDQSDVGSAGSEASASHFRISAT